MTAQIDQCNCGWSFYKRFENDHYCPQCRTKSSRTKTCIACGRVLEKYKNKICQTCSDLSITMTQKLYIREYMRKYRGYKTMKECFDNIGISIQTSDNNFISDCGVLDMDCEHCPYPDDCVLDTDYSDIEEAII